jgi:hypothetical protein|tara:strand:- start:1555 stop:2151 length:597 start_codon:yes stop_codon:yes gene_type:complete
MMSAVIFGSALLIYAFFWCWYVGVNRKVTPELVEQTIDAISQQGSAMVTDTHRKNIRHFLESDDGKDFVMVNLLTLKRPTTQARKKLTTYSKIFLGQLLKRAGHPVVQAMAGTGKIEFIGVPETEEWDSAFLVRYRSRKDFAEIIIDTAGSEHHGLKIASLERTVAFPASPWFIMGGPKLIVPLVLALLAALSHILLV